MLMSHKLINNTDDTAIIVFFSENIKDVLFNIINDYYMTNYYYHLMMFKIHL